MNTESLFETFGRIVVTSDADMAGIVSELMNIQRVAELKAERAALAAAERAAEDSGDDAAWAVAMDATDAWSAQTEAERTRLFGRSGWPQ